MKINYGCFLNECFNIMLKVKKYKRNLFLITREKHFCSLWVALLYLCG